MFSPGEPRAKNGRYLPTRFQKFGGKNGRLPSSLVSPAFKLNPRSNLWRPGGAPCKLDDKNAIVNLANKWQEEKKFHYNKRYIYPFSLKWRSSARVASSAAMIKEGVTFQITRFYWIELSARPSLGTSTAGHNCIERSMELVFLPRKWP